MEGQEQRLARFVADLALQPDKLVHYMDHPEAAMATAGLNEEERNVLGTGDFRTICDYLRPTRGRPTPVIDEGGPGGK
jgi:hypothetical protein